MANDQGERPADAAGSHPRAAVIFNPSKQGVTALREAVARAERRQEFAPTMWIETTEDDPGKGMAREAVDAGVDLVLAAGGDGTVRAVAAGLRDTGVPVGIVPLGTGNLFARNLGIPVNDLADAVVLAFSGIDHAVDVIVADITRPDGSDESHVSLVLAGIGIDAAMISNTNPDLKKRVGWLAYVDAGLRAIPASKPYRATHRLDSGRNHRSKVASILVANLGYLPGNIELIPGAELDDGKLDVVVLQPRNIFGWILIWRTVTWENRVLRKSTLGRQLIDLTGGNKKQHIVYLRGRSVEIGIEGAPEEFEIDGDEFGQVIGATFTVSPASLVVRVAR
ncbi:NAD(+)/NADH kinase [Agromyces sp. SYSU K20354]|uniref:diacylglycerol/lipid kinase family protein n=1 Tax=Agromyces cavernae TaxID=2898659 RepID=UPI001E635AF9|nr:diacylglycerol kinase family protein [Agromyces cavernae]MCD2443567.1 NAD(+)/NADH kinase [Agromyces cavernae]